MVAGVKNPERTRQFVGLGCYSVLMLIGAFLFFAVFVIPAALQGSGDELTSMILAVPCAMPPLVVYLWLPWIIDRYDPEPWWCLAMALFWGAIGAVGIAGFINTIIGSIFTAIGGGDAGEVLTATLSAPPVEEFWKGIGVFGFFYFLRREFDGVVDGVIYATFIALGFAATENVIYYARAILEPQEGALAVSFFLRGVVGPWGHPLYTSMTGIGFGIARETHRTWLKWLAPIGGYCCAMFLHFTWNFVSSISSGLFVLSIIFWWLLVAGFVAVIFYLVSRKGKIIREHLKDEVMLGNLTQKELDMVCSPVGRWKAMFSYGGLAGRRFCAAAARLGLSKWHAVRAQKGRKRTVSMDFIVPLRQELFNLREEIARSKGGQIERPRAWAPPPAQQPAPQQAYAPPQQQQWRPPQGGGGWGPPGGGWGPR